MFKYGDHLWISDNYTSKHIRQMENTINDLQYLVEIQTVQ
jgi:hypothetical protein